MPTFPVSCPRTVSAYVTSSLLLWMAFNVRMAQGGQNTPLESPVPALAASGVASDLEQKSERGAYLVGRGDRLTVRIFGAEGMPDVPVEVEPDGKVNLPMVGKCQAEGLSIRQLEGNLAKLYSTFFKSPEVTVSVADYRSQIVTVVGSVNAPGVIQLQRSTRLMEVISQAGGLRTEAGNRVIINRPISAGYGSFNGDSAALKNANFSILEIDLKRIMEGADPSSNILVQAGDLITVPRAKMVYVVGDVGRPGGYVLDGHSSSFTVLQALALAGGANKTAKTGETRVLRASNGSDAHRTETQINLKRILAGRSPDFPLYAEDILFVPNSAAKNAGARAFQMATDVTTGLAVWRF